jgi:hypothetical protein
MIKPRIGNSLLVLGLLSFGLVVLGMPACGGSGGGGTGGKGGKGGGGGHAGATAGQGGGTAGATAGQNGSAGATAGQNGSAGATAGQDGGTAGATAGQDGGSAGATAGQDGGSAGHDGAAGSDGGNVSEAGGDVALDVPLDVPATDLVSESAVDVSTPDAGASCTGACNTLAQLGAHVSRTVDAGAVPAMTGGTIQNGVYVLTAIVQYNNDNTAYTLKQTSQVIGNVDTWVSSVNMAADVHYTATFATATNQLTLTLCCPAAATLAVGYTVTANGFQNVDPSNANRVFTFTKQ